MAVKTIWPIRYACGHQDDRDLSDRPADRRAGFAEWLAKQKCTDCWRADTDERTDQDKADWLKARQEESDAWAVKFRMPPLEGTERSVPWGVRCRHQIMDAAHTALVLEGDTSMAEWEKIEDNARTVTRAGWWIDQRFSQPEDLPELLQAATGADRPTENPHF
ncbi:hypothetical protein [Streptomyces sp. NPDC093071]|uniref:hypothetical protein n=1 Tax=Streptomyces sp. NPDC093071 TaxID=3366022 RepID=UPI00381773A6